MLGHWTCHFEGSDVFAVLFELLEMLVAPAPRVKNRVKKHMKTCQRARARFASLPVWVPQFSKFSFVILLYQLLRFLRPYRASS